jgi:hypothetical protein
MNKKRVGKESLAGRCIMYMPSSRSIVAVRWRHMIFANWVLVSASDLQKTHTALGERSQLIRKIRKAVAFLLKSLSWFMVS